VRGRSDRARPPRGATVENALADDPTPATIARMRRILDFLTRASRDPRDDRGDVPGWAKNAFHL
jgi:hypothetical protein